MLTMVFRNLVSLLANLYDWWQTLAFNGTSVHGEGGGKAQCILCTI